MIKCTVCDFQWSPIAKEMIRNRPRGCKNCNSIKRRKNISKSLEQVLHEIKEIHGNKFTLVGGYISTNTKTQFKCEDCQYQWNTKPSDLLRIKGCPNCNNSRKDIDDKEFKERLYKRFNGRIISLDTYTNMNSKMRFYCIDCKHSWSTKAHSPLNRKIGCKKCADQEKTKSHNKFLDEIYNLTGNEYEVLSPYKGKDKKLLLKHSLCGEEWRVTPNAFLRNTRCPNCKRSKGEEKIVSFLECIGIKYTKQIRFKDCKSTRSLPFDVYTNKLLIEFDGGQHFYPISSWGGEVKFEETQHHDKIKNQYCIQNKIPLIRIPYWEFDNIDHILESALMHFNIIERSDAYDVNKFIEWLVDESWNHDEYLAKCPKNKKDAEAKKII